MKNIELINIRVLLAKFDNSGLDGDSIMIQVDNIMSIKNHFEKLTVLEKNILNMKDEVKAREEWNKLLTQNSGLEIRPFVKKDSITGDFYRSLSRIEIELFNEFLVIKEDESNKK